MSPSGVHNWQLQCLVQPLSQKGAGLLLSPQKFSTPSAGPLAKWASLANPIQGPENVGQNIAGEVRVLHRNKRQEAGLAESD